MTTIRLTGKQILTIVAALVLVGTSISLWPSGDPLHNTLYVQNIKGFTKDTISIESDTIHSDGESNNIIFRQNKGLGIGKEPTRVLDVLGTISINGDVNAEEMINPTTITIKNEIQSPRIITQYLTAKDTIKIIAPNISMNSNNIINNDTPDHCRFEVTSNRELGKKQGNGTWSIECFAPGECGNGIIDAGEECEYPGDLWQSWNPTDLTTYCSSYDDRAYVNMTCLNTCDQIETCMCLDETCIEYYTWGKCKTFIKKYYECGTLLSR